MLPSLPLLLLALAAPGLLFAQAPPWETTRLDIDIRLLPEEARFEGSATLRLRPLDASASRLEIQVGEAIFLGAVETEGDRDVIGEKDSSSMLATLRFDRPVEAGEEIEVRVAFASAGRGSQMVVDGTAAFASWARTWYPIAGSHRAPGTTRISMPRAWRAVASGGLAERSLDGDRALETWKSERPLAPSPPDHMRSRPARSGSGRSPCTC